MQTKPDKTPHPKYSRAINICTFIASFIFIIVFSSCQKEATGDVGTPNTTPTAPTTSSNVKTYSIDAQGANGTHDVTIFNLTYDANNRITSFISTTSPGDKIVYNYNGNSYTMDIFEANVLSIHEIFYLNSIPLVDSSFQYDAASKDTTTEKYTYNSSKQLVTLKNYNYSKVTGAKLTGTNNYIYDNSGNMSTLLYNATTITYEYYPDLLNTMSLGMIYFQQSKNLVKTTNETNGALTAKITNYTYTFDSNNRITSEKRVFSGGGETVIETYTY